VVDPQISGSARWSDRRVPNWAGSGSLVILLLVILLLCLGFSIAGRNFFSLATFSTMARGNVSLLLVSLGMTAVMLVGGIDLSVGAVMALASVTFVMLRMEVGLPEGIAILGALGTGVLCGWLNGLITVAAKVPSFVVTLGMLEAARGIGLWWTRSQSHSVRSSIDWVATPKLLGLSPAVFLSLVVVVMMILLIRRTVLGRYWIAIGTNAEAVRLSGVGTAAPTVAAFSICGLLAGLAGLIQVGETLSAKADNFAGMELQAIAACVIGGTSLAGGKGSVIGTLLGTCLLAVLQTGLAQMGAADSIKRLVTGLIIVGAVVIDAWRQRRASQRIS
jgi:ribose transport system permease protein